MCDEAEEGTPDEVNCYQFQWLMPVVWVVKLLAMLARVVTCFFDEVETDVIAVANHGSYQRAFADEVRADLENIPTTQE